MNPDNLTHDHGKQPNPVKFGTVVILAFAFLLVALLAAFLFLKKDASKVVPHPPASAPNASLRLTLPVQEEAWPHC